MICTIYSHYLVLDRILEMVRETIPGADIKITRPEGGAIIDISIKDKTSGFSLYKKSSKLKITYRERAKPSYMLPETDDSALTTNLRGMYGFVHSLPTLHAEVKNRFLHKILTINSEFSIEAEGEVNDLGILIPRFAKEFDAFVFTQPGLPISRAGGQHFLDSELRLLMDMEGNSELDTLEVNIDAKYFDNPAPCTESQEKRKKQSEDLIRKRQIAINNHLPCIQDDNDTILRSPKDIARRICVLAMTNYVAFDNLTGEDAAGYLRHYGLWDYVTEGEKAFLANPTEETKSYETWKCEGIWTLLWAVKKIDDFYFPDKLCNLDSIPSDEYPVGPDKDPNDFINTITGSRSTKEILDANDLHYRINWACVEARIKGEEIEGVHPGVVYERCYALNWLIGYRDQEWDDVSCDT